MRTKTLVVVAGVLAAAFATFVAASDAPDGKALYAAKCAMCHGVDGVAKPMGKGSASFDNADFQKANDVEKIAGVAIEGKGKMPKFAGKLTPDDAKAIAEYVKTLGAPKK